MTFRRQHAGSRGTVLLIVMALLAVMAVLMLCVTESLCVVKKELKLIEKKQVQRYEKPAASEERK